MTWSTLIERLQKKGLTYASDGSIYFRIAKFPQYGKLSKIDTGRDEGGSARGRGPVRKG